jgi:PAS domain S-box-containing protein
MNLAALLEPLGEPAAAFDDEGNLVYCNQEARQLLGYQPEEDLSDLHLSDFYPEREYERILQDAYPRAVREGAWHSRVAMRTKTDRIIETDHLVECRLTREGTLKYMTIRARPASSAV